MEIIERIAIDLLWLRPGKVGGTESYIRNLLDGFESLSDDFLFTLLVSRDNANTFQKYTNDKRFSLLVANVESANIAKRILWQNMKQNRFLKKHGIRKCFEPVYCKPWFNGGIKYICVIHDLQAYHYPHYHPVHEVVYSRICWRMDIVNAKKIIAISSWVKQDLLNKYSRKEQDIKVIYNPITIRESETVPFETLECRYDIKVGEFYYTVAQLIPHKNLKTLIDVIAKIKKEQMDLPAKLLITGIKGEEQSNILQMIKEYDLQDNILLTGYLENAERNTLYKNCKAFLFPSVFEGFGMPPIEAMFLGGTVITTRCTSIPEVTQNEANYVNDPYNVNDWIEIMKNPQTSGNIDFSRFNGETIAREYLQFLMENL